MKPYEEQVVDELIRWHKKMMKKPSIASRLSKGTQNRVNNLIPEKVHSIITEVIKNMVKGVLVGSEYITRQPLRLAPIGERERLVRDKIRFYKKAAALSGAGTGAGGIMLGLADLPVLMSLKIKFLFDTASLYGFDVRDYRERIYILYIFQLAFSSQERRLDVYKQVLNWNEYSRDLPDDINSFDWRIFQQEYRDYIDLSKMLQLIPGIGAVVGAVANYRLMDKLGDTAINSYRLRLFRERI